LARGRAPEAFSTNSAAKVRSGTTNRAQRDAISELRAARIDVRCEKDWLCSMNVDRECLTAKHVEALSALHMHAGPAAESFFLLVLASCVAQMLIGGLWMLANRS
jgi:hypothetical protein